MKKRCFLIGNRDTNESIAEQLSHCVIDPIENRSVCEFIAGTKGNFDRISARTLIRVKEKHPDIILTLLSPYYPGTRPIELPDGFNGIYYPFERPVLYRCSIVQANKKAICNYDSLIACVNHPGKARDFLYYALIREKKGLIQTVNIGSMQVL